MAFNSLEDAAAWVAKRGGNLDLLRADITSGSITGKSAEMGLAYLEMQDRATSNHFDATQLDLMKAGTDAEIRAANAAERAVFVAVGSAVVSVIALAVSIAALFKP